MWDDKSVFRHRIIKKLEQRDVGRMIQLLVVYKKLLIWKRYNIKKYQDYCVAFNFYFLGNPVFYLLLNGFLLNLAQSTGLIIPLLSCTYRKIYTDSMKKPTSCSLIGCLTII